MCVILDTAAFARARRIAFERDFNSTNVFAAAAVVFAVATAVVTVAAIDVAVAATAAVAATHSFQDLCRESSRTQARGWFWRRLNWTRCAMCTLLEYALNVYGTMCAVAPHLCIKPTCVWLDQIQSIPI